MNINKIKLNPSILNYNVFDFVDYKNETHKVTIAVVRDEEVWHNITYIKIGVAIQNPKDEYIEFIGANRAAKMAHKGDTWVSATFKGIRNKVITDALIENEWQFVQENINLFIRGYKDEEKKFREKIQNEDMELLDRI